MRKSIIALSLAACFVSTSFASEIPKGFPQTPSAEVYQALDLGTLIRAYNDMHPEAAFMALYNSYYAEGSTPQNIGIMETSVDSRQNVLTANSETIYAVHPVNLDKQGGAVVIEAPSGVMGMINGAGWTNIGDMGFTGPDKGQGGKYLITSPSYKGDIPQEYHHFKADTNTIVWLMRGFVQNNDSAATVDHMKAGIKTYSLSDANNAPETTFYNTSESTTVNGKNMDMLYLPKDVFPLIQQYFKENSGLGHEKHAYLRGHLFDAGFFDGTADKALLAQATQLGNERQMTLTFNNRSASSHKWGGDNMWQWSNNVADEFYNGKDVNFYLPSQHQHWAHQATFTAAAMTRPPEGVGAAYIMNSKSSDGEWLVGDNHYTLDIPADVPAANFWSLIAYNAVYRSMIRNDDFQWGVNSYAEGLTKNENGSVTIHFAPAQPEGVSGKNWIQTNQGEAYFMWFRSYSPTKTWYDNSWELPNIEKMK